MSKFCTKCGTQLEDGAKFCYKCGAKQDIKQATSTPNQEQARQSTFQAGTAETVKRAERQQVDNSYQQHTYNQTSYTAPAQEQSKVGHGGLLKYVAIFLVIVAAVVGYLAFSDGQPVATPKNQPAQGLIAVKAEELLDDYIRDQGTAEAKYKNKKVNISGKVIYKNEFKNSQRFQVTLAHKTAAGRSYFVSLDFPQNMVEIVNQKKIGDFVVAEGTCVGIVKQDKPTDISVQVRVEKSGGNGKK